MYNPNGSYREQRRYYRAQRRYYRYSNPMRGLAGGIFLIAMAIGFALHGAFGGTSFLVFLFVGLAFASLFGSLSTMHRHSIYGGMHGFVWMLGLALCFWIGFWPWILLPIAATMILGALFNPITTGLAGSAFLAASQMQPSPQQQPYQETYPPQEQPYQQGYQGATYQEGGQVHQYDQQPKQQHEQPQVEYPEQQQELPPMQQS